MQVVRVHAFRPAVADLVLQTASPELQPRLVEEVAALVGARAPHHHGSGVGHHPEAFLALTQRALGTPPVSPLDQQPGDQRRLQQQHGKRAENVATVLLEDARFAKPELHAWGDASFADVPPTELAPIERIDVRNGGERDVLGPLAAEDAQRELDRLFGNPFG